MPVINLLTIKTIYQIIENAVMAHYNGSTKYNIFQKNIIFFMGPERLRRVGRIYQFFAPQLYKFVTSS